MGVCASLHETEANEYDDMLSLKRVGEEGAGDIVPVLKEVFDLMDLNGDGHIDEEEGKALGLALGETPEEAKESWEDMMRVMDGEGDFQERNGMVELEEWIAFYQKKVREAPVKQVLKQLHTFRDEIKKWREANPQLSGKIDHEELHRVASESAARSSPQLGPSSKAGDMKR